MHLLKHRISEMAQNSQGARREKRDNDKGDFEIGSWALLESVLFLPRRFLFSLLLSNWKGNGSHLVFYVAEGKAAWQTEGVFSTALFFFHPSRRFVDSADYFLDTFEIEDLVANSDMLKGMSRFRNGIRRQLNCCYFVFLAENVAG